MFNISKGKFNLQKKNKKKINKESIYEITINNNKNTETYFVTMY